MSLSMAPLLMHSRDVPAIVRAELQAAYAATSERRDEHLLTAARMLSWIIPLDCDDALELVGLPVVETRAIATSNACAEPTEAAPASRRTIGRSSAER